MTELKHKRGKRGKGEQSTHCGGIVCPHIHRLTSSYWVWARARGSRPEDTAAEVQ